MGGKRTKKDYISLFNRLINGEYISFQDDLLPIIYDYLTECKFENSEKIINLIKQNPQLSNGYLLQCIKFYCIKYGIFSLIYKNKIILYYE